MSIAMSPQHKSLREEILYVLGRASAPLDSGQIYERCTLAEEIKRVGDALWVLRDTKKIVAVEGEGRKRYMLAKDAPAPVLPAADPESAPAPETKPAAPAIEIPVLTAAKSKRGPYKKRTDAAAAPDVVPGVAQQIKPVPEAAKAPVNAGKIADAMLAEVREQLGRQMTAPAESLGEQRLPVIHIHIEQVDIHLGGL